MTSSSVPGGRPTIVLVHGAFAESSSWNGVIRLLLDEHFPVLAVAVPLRGVRTDSEYLASVLATLAGDLVLVGHSYGGTVITNAATANERVKGLVYVGGLAPGGGGGAASPAGGDAGGN